MKKTKRFVGAVCLAIVMAMVAPSIVPGLAGVETVEAATKVKLNKTKVTLYVGKSVQLKVKGTTKKATWKSSNKKVATVTSKGKVTAKKKGKATITAKVSGKKYTCKVTVKEVALKSISLNKTSLTLEKGNKYTLSVKYKPSNTTVNKKVRWSSSNSSVATVDKNGNIYASSAGKATITAKVGNKTAKCVVTVKEQPSEDSSNDDSSSDDNSKEDTIKERTPAENLNKLKEYISLYGSVNSNGDKYIARTDSIDGTEYTIGITYKSETEMFIFYYIRNSGDKGVSVINTSINIRSYNNVLSEYGFYCEKYYMGIMGQVTYNATKYNSDNAIYFEITERIGVTAEDAQKLANSELKSGFAGWNYLMYTRTGLYLKDIGFTSYK